MDLQPPHHEEQVRKAGPALLQVSESEAWSGLQGPAADQDPHRAGVRDAELLSTRREQKGF